MALIQGVDLVLSQLKTVVELTSQLQRLAEQRTIYCNVPFPSTHLLDATILPNKINAIKDVDVDVNVNEKNSKSKYDNIPENLPKENLILELTSRIERILIALKSQVSNKLRNLLDNLENNIDKVSVSSKNALLVLYSKQILDIGRKTLAIVEYYAGIADMQQIKVTEFNETINFYDVSHLVTAYSDIKVQFKEVERMKEISRLKTI